MQPVAAVARIVKATLKRWGGSRVKRRIWDREFRQDAWSYLDRRSREPDRQDPVIALISRYASGGDILDLGCGAGSTGLEIAGAYRQYLGIDISEVAIAKAVLAADDDASLFARPTYVASDIESYVPAAFFSVILFRESLYYVQRGRIESTLARYSSFLAPNGVFIVRLHDRLKYRYIVDLICENYSIREQYAPEDGKTIILIFSPMQKTDGAK